MSVLNQSADEPVECPLCMEPLEVDDLNFFPCTCGYQICRFCWHRIRTDENGLCPACRKAYPEDPADFKPLSKEDFARIKAEKRQKNQQKKQKITENRKTLGNVRVVQKNLVFVLGLPARLAETEVLKRHEYFGKFGKILKVVVNQSTAYAGNQGPCASAYVTYSRSEDALRAIQAVNNISVDGRVIKTSLGTTKYCSHFMKNQACPKTDCMYLHEMGDPEASFTKEEMQQGKHQEFERKLHDQLLCSSQQQLPPLQSNSFAFNRKPTPSPPSVQLNQFSLSSSSPVLQTSSSGSPSNTSNRNSPTILNPLASCSSTASLVSQSCSNSALTAKEEWPSLRSYSPTNSCYTDSNDTKERIVCSFSDHSDSTDNVSESYSSSKKHTKHSKKKNNQSYDRKREESETVAFSDTSDSSEILMPDTLQTEILETRCETDTAQYTISQLQNSQTNESQIFEEQIRRNQSPVMDTQKSAVIFNRIDNDNNSFFSSNDFSCNTNGSSNSGSHSEWILNGESHMSDVLPPVQSNEDWQAAFGFSNGHNGDIVDDTAYRNDDDLGFDPFTETQKALAEMIEKEKQSCSYHYLNNNSDHSNHSNINNNSSNHHSNNNNNSLLNNNNNLYQKRFIAMQQNNRLANCTKLLDELRINSVLPPRTHVPPPGFSNTSNHMNAFGLGIPRTGSKILPFSQQTLTAFQQHTTPAMNNFKSVNNGIAAWDWSSIDPAIVSTGQHCELYATQPPPGFTLTPTIDSKYLFNNYI